MKFEIGVQNTLMSSLALLAGAVLALLLGWMRGKKAGICPKKLALATVLTPLFTAFFAHLGYCLVCVADVLYTQPAGFWLAFWQPGQLFYGGMLGAVLALCIAGGSGKLKLLESYAPSMALMTVFARLAEGFSGQGYGEYWYEENGFFCRFPFMTYDPYCEYWGWALFMAGAAVALAIFILLMVKKPSFDGDGVLLFFGLYAAGQIVLESLRRDEFLRWGFIRSEQLFSAITVLVVLILYWVRTGRARAVCKSPGAPQHVAMVVFCLRLEVATEGRIPFLVFLDVWHCYALMAAACVVDAACVLCMRRMTLPKEC